VQVNNKETDGFKISLFELITYVLIILFVFFNTQKTKKMGRIYEDLNVTASDYSLYFRVTESFLNEFQQWFPNY